MRLTSLDPVDLHKTKAFKSMVHRN